MLSRRRPAPDWTPAAGWTSLLSASVTQVAERQRPRKTPASAAQWRSSYGHTCLGGTHLAGRAAAPRAACGAALPDPSYRLRLRIEYYCTTPRPIEGSHDGSPPPVGLIFSYLRHGTVRPASRPGSGSLSARNVVAESVEGDDHDRSCAPMTTVGVRETDAKVAARRPLWVRERRHQSDRSGLSATAPAGGAS